MRVECYTVVKKAKGREVWHRNIATCIQHALPHLLHSVARWSD